MEEFKRVFGIKFIMVFTVTVLLNIGLFVYSSSEGKSMSDIRQETHYRQWIIGELSDMQPEEALEIAERIGYPVMVRPSYVLGGQGMQIAICDEDIDEFIGIINQIAQEHPIQGS